MMKKLGITVGVVALATLFSACLLEEEGLDEDSLTELERGLQKSQGGTNFDWDYCSPPYGMPGCLSGEGDCDSDEGCDGALVCGTNNGKYFGQPTSMDVCWPDSCETRTLFLWNYCSAQCPCLAGEGDCDPQPGHCVGGTVCGTDNGARYGSYATNDICWPAVCETRNLWDWNYCTPDCPCAAGMGDCDTDADCAPGLSCSQNVGAAYGQHPVYDVCE